MFKDTFVFSQIVSFLDRNKFNHILRKYGGDKYVKHFTCWNQLLCLMFGQLSNRASLQDLIVALEAHRGKLYHLGPGKNVSKTTLAKSNQERDYRIFEEYAYFLLMKLNVSVLPTFSNSVVTSMPFDSTTIDLCLNVFWWAKFRKKKGGIKVHTLYDIETQILKFFHITEAHVHDSNIMKERPYESKYYYIFDRGYNNFKNLYHIHLVEAKFVVRAKKDLKFKTFKWKRTLPPNVLSDAIVELTGTTPKSTTRSNFVSLAIGMKNKNVSSFSSQMRWTYLLFSWPNFIRTDGRLNSFPSGSSNI